MKRVLEKNTGIEITRRRASPFAIYLALYVSIGAYIGKNSLLSVILFGKKITHYIEIHILLRRRRSRRMR